MPKLYKGRKAKRSKVGRRVHTVKDKIARNYDLEVEINPDFLPKPVDRSALEDASSRVTSPFAHYPGQMGSSRTRMPNKEAQYLEMLKHDRFLMYQLSVSIRNGNSKQIADRRRNLEAHRSRLGNIASAINPDLATGDRSKAVQGRWIASPCGIPHKR